MPIHIRLKKGNVPTQYRPVTEADQEIQLLLPVEPKDITLDDERTLLAEYIKKK